MERELLESIGISAEAEGKVRELWAGGSIRLDIPIIDLQHMWLVALIQELAQVSTSATQDTERLKKLLIELVDFATEHFSLEEELTGKFGYPEHVAHKQQHQHFIEFLDARVQEIKMGQSSTVRSLVNFLMDWLTMHIQKEDKQYRDFFTKTGANIKEHLHRLISRRDITVDRAQAALYNLVSGKSEVVEILNESVLSNVLKIWNTHNLAVHIPIIDLQHLWLISMIVELDIASKTLASARRQKIFNKVVLGAMDYTKEHFSTEERIMEKFGYKQYQAHFKQHQAFIEMVQKRHSEALQGDGKAASHLVDDLKEWLVSHIAIEDRNIYVGLKDQISDVQIYVRDLINSGQLVVKKKQVDLYNQVCGLKKA